MTKEKTNYVHPNEPSMETLLEIQKDKTLTAPQRHALEVQIARRSNADS